MRSKKNPFNKGRQFTAEVILAMVRKGQVVAMPVSDMPAQAAFIASLFGVAA